MGQTSGRNRALWTIAIVNLLLAWMIVPGMFLALYSATALQARRTMQEAYDAGAVTVDPEKLAPVLGLQPDHGIDHDTLAIRLLRPLEQDSFDLAATIAGVLTVESLILMLVAFLGRSNQQGANPPKGVGP